MDFMDFFGYTSRMVINYAGEGCVKIQSGSVSITVDPQPRFKGDVVLHTLNEGGDTNFPTADIAGAGEYEVKGVEVYGWQLIKESTAKVRKTIYSVRAEDMNLVFLGQIAETLEPTFLEKLGSVDVLFIPAGGKPMIDEEVAAKLIKQLGPRLVVGIFVKKEADAKKFLKENDQKAEILDKLVIKKKELAEGKTRFVILTG